MAVQVTPDTALYVIFAVGLTSLMLLLYCFRRNNAYGFVLNVDPAASSHELNIAYYR